MSDHEKNIVNWKIFKGENFDCIIEKNDYYFNSYHK